VKKISLELMFSLCIVNVILLLTSYLYSSSLHEDLFVK